MGVVAVAGALAALLPACGGPSGTRPPAEAVRPTPRTSSEPQAAATALPALPIVDPRYAEAVRYSAEHAGLSLLVIHRGEVVVETGHGGAEARAPRPLFSGTKSFWGVLAVAAAEDGLLSLDERVVDTLPEFARDRWKRDITIRQLLDATSGLESGFVPLRRDRPQSWYRRALQLEMIAPPGERFQYGPSHLFVFGEVLRRKLEPSGEDPLAYLTRRIFAPIGLEVAAWGRDAAGNPDLPSGAVLRPRGWARFGALLRDGGRAAGQEVVPPRALDACFRGSEVQPAYGLAFWLNAERTGDTAASPAGMLGRPSPDPVFLPGELPDLVVAAGAGNQRLYVSREAELVAVRFGDVDRTWEDAAFLSRLLVPPAPAPAPGGAGTSQPDQP